MRVENMIGRSGSPVANQFILYNKDFTMFQSYNSMIVKTTFEEGKQVVYLDSRYWAYSRTTSKYRNMFLGEDTKTIKNKIKSGEYRLTNLN